jgi:hypothetical protein
MTNTTLQETDSRITYKGTWDNNTNPLFSGGGTTYTNSDASFSFAFEGEWELQIRVKNRLCSSWDNSMSSSDRLRRLDLRRPGELSDAFRSLW